MWGMFVLCCVLHFVTTVQIFSTIVLWHCTMRVVQLRYGNVLLTPTASPLNGLMDEQVLVTLHGYKLWMVHLKVPKFEYQRWIGIPLTCLLLGISGLVCTSLLHCSVCTVLAIIAINTLQCSCPLRQQLSLHGESSFPRPYSSNVQLWLPLMRRIASMSG